MTDDTLRTYVYAPPRSVAANPATLPAKAPRSRRIYQIDFALLLRLLGQPAILGAVVEADAPLIRGAAGFDSTSVTFHLGGGAVGVPAGRVCIALLFADDVREDVVLVQPMLPASPDVPDDAVSINSELVTVAYRPLEIGDMPLLPGGLQAGDLTLVVRPGVDGAPDFAGRLPVTQLGGGGAVADLVFFQAIPAATWTITHNLGRHPQPRVVTSSGDLVDCAANYPDANTVILTFAAPFAGTAYL